MDKSTPFFSLILPTRNRAELLRRCIESVADQSFQSFELIIVDDGSDDHSKIVVESFSLLNIVYVFQEHKERSSARNLGIKYARGKYICFLDDDDLISSEFLLDFHTYYQDNGFPEVILRTGFTRLRGESEKKAINYKPRKHLNPVRFAAFNMCGIWTLSIPRRFLEEEEFPVNFPHWQDTHLILRLFMKYPLVQLDSHNYTYCIHPSMGSLRAVIDYDVNHRADLNVSAIRNLFNSHELQLKQFLPVKTLEYLVAEKYIQYYVNDYSNTREFNNALWKKAVQYGFFLRLWKYYLLIAKSKIGF